MKNKKIQTLQDWIDDSSNIVVYSGAALSEESGVPDFRKMEADYSEQFNFPPAALFSRSFFERRPGEFFRFFREKMLAPLLTAEPNPAHLKIAELEAAGKLKRVITETMDGLHYEAGSRKLLELNGSVSRIDCPRADCERKLNVLDLYESSGVPYCDVDMCGDVMRPEVVLFGEGLDKELLTTAAFDILNADLLIIAGAALTEAPAAGLIHLYMRRRMVLIHPGRLPGWKRADLFIQKPVSQVLEQIRIQKAALS